MLEHIETLDPNLKNEIRLICYIFAQKWLDLLEHPQFLQAFSINCDLLVLKRFGTRLLIRQSQALFQNLLLLEEPENNNFQFKKYLSRFLNLVQSRFQKNLKLLSGEICSNQNFDLGEIVRQKKIDASEKNLGLDQDSSKKLKNSDEIAAEGNENKKESSGLENRGQRLKKIRQLLKSFSEFYNFVFSAKAGLLGPRKFETRMSHLNFEPENQKFVQNFLKFYRLGENYFDIAESDFQILSSLLILNFFDFLF